MSPRNVSNRSGTRLAGLADERPNSANDQVDSPKIDNFILGGMGFAFRGVTKGALSWDICPENKGRIPS